MHRRISIGPEERIGNRLRTASEQLTEIALRDNELDRLTQEPLAIQRRHDLAFNVEQVTRKFYSEYHATFALVERDVRGISDPDRKRLFIQRLFNRLMFIEFIQRKGWLNFNGERDYLRALWDNYHLNPHPAGFFHARLELLYFAGLDNPANQNLIAVDRNETLSSQIGKVPYLNGGLFQKVDGDQDPSIIVPDKAIERILFELFDSFNFTVTESTPLDVEVAVDPEMLGKVFEELVTGRHETGSYYTPKPIVSFMCQEALKSYLSTSLPDEPAEAIASLVEDYEPALIHDPEGVLDALRNVRACDPACGSGAYLLGLLHELLEIRSCLFAAHHIDAPKDYDRKLEIIQENLYGVDIDPFAVNIARLRLWLSLAVDYDGPAPQPLPNLDFKIERGDSLLGRDVGAGRQLALRKQQVADYHEYKALYMMSHGEDKRVLEGEVEKLRQQLALWAHGGQPVEGFDWPVEFAEIFAAGGFDIVLANPPYVRQELITEIKPALKAVYGLLYSGTADLYVFFYYRALELLKPGGALVFISSNKWFKAAYGKKLRALMAETTAIHSITDFRDLPVFESATAYPMIFATQKLGGERIQVEEASYVEVPNLEPPYPDVRQVIAAHGTLLPPEAFDGERWTLTDRASINVIRAMEAQTVPLGKYVNNQIYRGVLTGFNKAFVIDGAKRAELIAADPKSAEIIKSLAVGRDIRRWTVKDSDRWLIVTKIGVDIKRYPAVFEHLSQWKRELRVRRDQGKHWWELRACAYYDVFERPKVVFPDIATDSKFALDCSGFIINDTTFMIATSDLFVLGTLNSSITLDWYRRISPEIRGGFLRWKRQYVTDIPIPIPSNEDCDAISKLAERCVQLTSSGSNVSTTEIELDERIRRLYGF